jgi:hypothetical protein
MSKGKKNYYSNKFVKSKNSLVALLIITLLFAKISSLIRIFIFRVFLEIWILDILVVLVGAHHVR